MNAKVPDEYMIPIENLMNPRALDFHAASEYIYFADATSYIIGRQKIDGTERDTILKEGESEALSTELLRPLTFTDATSCSRLSALACLWCLRYSHSGGDRSRLDGWQPLLDRRRAQEDHQRGQAGEGFPDQEDPH